MANIAKIVVATMFGAAGLGVPLVAAVLYEGQRAYVPPSEEISATMEMSDRLEIPVIFIEEEPEAVPETSAEEADPSQQGKAIRRATRHDDPRTAVQEPVETSANKEPALPGVLFPAVPERSLGSREVKSPSLQAHGFDAPPPEREKRDTYRYQEDLGLSGRPAP